MLVLTRKIGQQVRIAPDVTISVLGVRSGQVSLGFVAPGEVKIFREEVLRRIESENRRALLESRDRLAAVADLWEAYDRRNDR
jgi:carbon storage regulator